MDILTDLVDPIIHWRHRGKNECVIRNIGAQLMEFRIADRKKNDFNIKDVINKQLAGQKKQLNEKAVKNLIDIVTLANAVLVPMEQEEEYRIELEGTEQGFDGLQDHGTLKNLEKLILNYSMKLSPEKVNDMKISIDDKKIDIKGKIKPPAHIDIWKM